MQELEKIMEEIDDTIEDYSGGSADNAFRGFVKGLKRAKRIICKHMNDGWTPVEDRLPDKGENVLCYFKYEPESPDVICENIYIGSGIWQSETEKVVAWRQRPEKYQAKHKEEKKSHFMTENDAIKEIRRLCCNESQYYPKGENLCKDRCMYGENLCAFSVAIKALEEVQEYRKIGTVEEVREAVKKQKPIRKSRMPILSRLYCPVCGVYNDEKNIKTKRMFRNYCVNCGQRLEREE